MSCTPWNIDVTDCCNQNGIDPDDARVPQIIQQVTEMMSLWSGYRYGGCRTTRPLDPCGECRSGCCASGDCIVLHDATGVSAVRIDGDEVDASEWHYDAARGTLCAVPPLSWPTRDPRYDATGALEVDVRVGEEPDAWTLSVATELACELLAACAGKKCRIPSNATRVSSQGITIEIQSDEIKYAIPSVMAWVASVNPQGATAPARIFSAEADRERVKGGRHSLPGGRRVASFRGF